MAESPAHKFGQLIGNLIESIVQPLLDNYCNQHELYLDYQGKKRAARKGKKVSWYDSYGNKHDLDYVIEKDGSDSTIGTPVAFIECAWRRYTKHSRNKAQEIQGAVIPLAEKHKWSNPFLGVVLAGVFTEGSLEQLRSLGFQIVYFPYQSFINAFASESIDIGFDESTKDEEFKKCVHILEQCPVDKIDRVKKNLVDGNRVNIDIFFAALNERLERLIENIMIIPLYGISNEFSTVETAINFLNNHKNGEDKFSFRKYCNRRTKSVPDGG